MSSKPYLTASPEERIASEVADLKARLAALESRIERPIAAASQGWQSPTLNSGWSNFGGGFASAGYYRDPLGVVWVRGLVVAGAGAGTTVFVLPSNYRPAANMLWMTIANTGSLVISRLDVQSDGAVVIVIPSSPIAYVSLNCAFRAA